VSVMAAQVIDAWRTVDLDGTVPGPGGSELPAPFAASILPIELLLHGWDLAEGSGQRLHVSDELVAYVRTLAETVVPAVRGNGSFADEVAPAVGASAVDRLAAFAGRTPVAA
jgi:uncharacterized protein (TIGR03086 family)